MKSSCRVVSLYFVPLGSLGRKKTEWLQEIRQRTDCADSSFLFWKATKSGGSLLWNTQLMIPNPVNKN